MDKRESSKRNFPQPRTFRRRSDIEKTNITARPGEAELRIAIEASGLGIFDYYPLSDELHWSHTAKEHFGLSPDAHVNYNVFLVGLHPEDRDRVDRLVHEALHRENGGRYGTEYRTIGIEDGKERWIAARGQAFFNNGGEAVRFIGTTLDITEHKRSEDALRESQERYRLLFDKSPLPKWVLDAETLAFLEVNDAAVEHYGYSRDEFRNLTLAHILTSDELKQFEQWMTAATQAGKKFEGRIRSRHRKKNQEIMDVDVRYTEIVYNGRKAMLDVVVEGPARRRAEETHESGSTP